MLFSIITHIMLVFRMVRICMHSIYSINTSKKNKITHTSNSSILILLQYVKIEFLVPVYHFMKC